METNKCYSGYSTSANQWKPKSQWIKISIKEGKDTKENVEE